MGPMGHVHTAPYHPASHCSVEHTVETLRDDLQKLSGQTLENEMKSTLNHRHSPSQDVAGEKARRRLLTTFPRVHLGFQESSFSRWEWCPSLWTCVGDSRSTGTRITCGSWRREASECGTQGECGKLYSWYHSTLMDSLSKVGLHRLSNLSGHNLTQSLWVSQVD
ncbi:uncharacterized protein V6R79_024811 [Siganus canaliculatus]